MGLSSGVPCRGPISREADPQRLRAYCLNKDHPGEGRHKAVVFESALGFGPEHAEELRRQILAGVRTAPVVKLKGPGYDPNTWKCEVHVEIEGANGLRVNVCTGWEVSPPPRWPKLLSAYVKGSGLQPRCRGGLNRWPGGQNG